MEFSDHILADSVEIGDTISFTWIEDDSQIEEVMTVRSMADNGDTIFVSGDSVNTPDRVEYFLSPDHPLAIVGVL